MKGDLVIAKSLDGPRVCRVAEDAGAVVFLSSEDQYALMESGKEALMPVGFPRASVFRWEDTAIGNDALVKWDALVPY